MPGTEFDTVKNMQITLWAPHRSRREVQRLVFTLARLLLIATLAVAAYLEIWLSAH
jgi:hypothetical protein